MARLPKRLPDFSIEAEARAGGFLRVAGVDEAGRGPLAGPVVAAAVILDPENAPEGLDDSKRLSAARREVLARALRASAAVSVAAASVEEIDALNVWGATALAMARACAPLAPDLALIDGKLVPRGLPCPARALVGGDGLSASIAAASILAKVERDRHMAALAQQDPRYGWARNKGYPTAAHHAALRQHGPTQHHRFSFGPIRRMLCPDGETS